MICIPGVVFFTLMGCFIWSISLNVRQNFFIKKLTKQVDMLHERARWPG